MTSQTRRLMVMAGGTGGHIFPGLAVAHHLIAHGWHVRWLGTADHMEADLVPKHGIKIDFIHIKGLRGNSMQVWLISSVHIWRAVRQARKIMRNWQPDVVLGMGGYVSGPGGLAAWSYGIPVLIHEQNCIAGMTNRWLSKIANKVLQAYPGTFPNAVVVGNPIRTDVRALPEPAIRLQNRSGPIRVLVIGGSQGAQILNHTMPAVAGRLGIAVTIWHQVGKGALREVTRAYAAVGRSAHWIMEFIDDIASAYAWADVVVCRSGALTVSEITTVGLPALFVPFIHKDYQQYWNAYRLEQKNAAKIIEQSQFTVDNVSRVLTWLDRPMLLAMAERARTLAIPDATERVAREVIMVMQS